MPRQVIGKCYLVVKTSLYVHILRTNKTCLYFFIFIITLNSYASKLLQGKIHDFSDRKCQVLLRSQNHEKDISILIRV